MCDTWGTGARTSQHAAALSPAFSSVSDLFPAVGLSRWGQRGLSLALELCEWGQPCWSDRSDTVPNSWADSGPAWLHGVSPTLPNASLCSATGSSRAQPHATHMSSTTGATSTSSSTSATTLSPSHLCAGPTRRTGTASRCWVRAEPGRCGAGSLLGHTATLLPPFPRHFHHGVDGR